MKCGPDTLLAKLQDTDMELRLSVKVGDLINFTGSFRDFPDPRTHGTVINFSTYNSGSSLRTERIVEILWNTGQLGWILAERVEVMEKIQ